jgi:hypothetical protein
MTFFPFFQGAAMNPISSFRSVWIFLFLTLCVITTQTSAQIPRTLSYQGILSDTLGTPKPDGMYAITFRLYDAPSGGTLLWVETQSLQVRRGLFSAVLGSQTPFPSSLTFERQYWLGIQPASDPELVPRIALTSVGYSLNSLRADTARVALNAGSFADSARIAGTVPNNSITANKIAAGQVVKSINNIRDAVTLRAQGGATITSSGDTITINAGSGGGGTGVQSIQNTNNTIDIINPTGPTVTTNLKVPLSLSGSSISPIISSVNSGSGSGVYGAASSGSGLTYGVSGITGSTTTNSAGVRGEALASSGQTIGVEGVSTASPAGTGVVGRGKEAGVSGINNSNGTGVLGFSDGGWGVYGASNNGLGVVGYHSGVRNYGALGGAAGAYGTSNDRDGVYGESNGGPNTAGVHGVGTGPSSTGIWGVGSGQGANTAGWFSGNVTVTGTLSKGGGSFRIDHPLDPANKYLYHSFVESPDMMNIYNGNVTTDANGNATIVLPEWFEALNKDFRYQLTVIDGSDRFVLAKVVSEIENNRFTIRTNYGNVKVSWQVTGIRHDPFAEAHRMQVEVEKTGRERGKYIHPKEYGVSETLGIEYEAYQKMEAERAKMKAEQERMQAEHEKMNLERQKMQPQPWGK